MSLKERIAALQQREDAARAAAASPFPPPSSSPPLPASTNGSVASGSASGAQAAALRAKIAQFESKGGVPVPRGSFGLGAPPEPATRKPQRAELYGNRMRPTPAATAASIGLERRPTSPFAALEEDHNHSHSRALSPQPGSRALSPQPGAGGGPDSPPRTTTASAKSTVAARGTAFSTALDIARKAEADVVANAHSSSTSHSNNNNAERERRRSGLWLAPQFTGGSLTLAPQFTGGSGSVGGGLTPQHTGGSGLASPPLSPYSPTSTWGARALRSPSLEVGMRSPSPSLRSPTLVEPEGEPTFADHEEPIRLTLEPEEEEEPTDADGREDEIEVEPEDEEERGEPVRHALAEAEPAPEPEPEEPRRELTPEAHAEDVPAPAAAAPAEDAAEPARERILDGQRSSAPSPSHTLVDDPPSPTSHSPSHSHLHTSPPSHTPVDLDPAAAAPAPDSPDSFHAGLPALLGHPFTAFASASASASAQEHEVAMGGYHDYSHGQGYPHPSGGGGYAGALDPGSGMGADMGMGIGIGTGMDMGMSTGAGTGYEYTYAYAARHLSTITERSAEPGSPGWEGGFSRFSVASAASTSGAGYPDEEEADDDENTDVDADAQEEEEVEGHMEAVEGAGRAGVGAGWHPGVSASPGVASFRDGEREGEGEALAGRRVIPTADARAPSPSPYRLSGLTERGYTPSLRSERDSVALDDEEREGEDGEEGEEGAREGEGEGEAPPTPTPYGSGQEHVPEGEEPPNIAVEVPSGAPQRDSLLSTHTRDSPATPSPRNSLAPSVRDSLAPSIRDSFSPSVRDSLLSADTPSQRDSLSSLSSTNTQTLLLRRPLSAIDTGSPSHVALAHRVPVLGVVGVAGAEQLFVPAGRTPTATPTNTPPANTLGPAWGAGDAEREEAPGRQPAETTHAPRRTVSAGAPRPSTTFDARPLPSAPASSSASTFPRARTPDGSGNARGQAHGPEPPRTPPRRHAYTTGAPRPHTAYIPPAEDPEDELYRGVDEFGTVSFGGGAPHSFSAIVHGRVREGAGPAPGSGRNTDKWGHERWASQSHGHGEGGHEEHEKRLPLPPTPMSPGYASGELAQLLAEAAALEVRLERGELPGEALRRRSMRPPPGRQGQGPAPPMPSMLSVVGEDKDKGREGARELKPQRSFRNPLSRSRSERRVRTDDVRPTAASSMGNLLALADDAQMARAPLSPTDSVPPTPPPKSPGFAGSTRYFSSLRRLASTSRSLGAAGAPGARGSVSTSNSSELSSEDSMGLVTPPDDGAAMQSGSNPTIAWPTLNTKRSVGSIGRNAASLAGRMFRTRTKSSASTVSSLEAPSPPPPLPVPTLPSPPVLKLDSTPFVIPPIQTSLHETDASESPTSSTPIADPFISLSATPATAKPKSSTPPTRPPHLTLNTSASGTAPPPAGLLHIPKTAPESRPESWMSVSSGGSSSMAPSPLFDKAIFDAFPSVPDMPPPHARNTPLSAGPTGSTRQLPILPSSPPPAYSDHSFSEGATLLGRLAETNRRVNPLL